MSFRAAARLIRELFPLASGGCADTVRRRIFAEADRIAARPPAEAGAEPPADSIYLGVDTTFVRSCVADGPRHHEVLIGIGVADNGRSQRIGGVIAALEMPHHVIAAPLCRPRRHEAPAVHPLPDGDKKPTRRASCRARE